MAYVVVARSAGEGQAAGHREGTSGIGDGETELVGGDLDGAGEAGIEVDVGDVVDADTGQAQGALLRRA